MSNLFNDWQKKYIEYKSQINTTYTDVQMASILNISRQTISTFKRNHPEINEIIADKLRLQYNKIGNKALQRLYQELDKKSINHNVLKMALEIGEHYVQKTDITNRIDNMTKEDKVKDILNTIKNINNKK